MKEQQYNEVKDLVNQFMIEIGNTDRPFDIDRLQYSSDLYGFLAWLDHNTDFDSEED